MPTVLRIGGMRVVIYPGDHLPPHVHVIDCDRDLVLEIAGLTMRRNAGFKAQEINQLRKALAEHVETLQSEWERIHGY
jgi:hypothetical protein